MTSLNMPGISLSLLNLTNISSECSIVSVGRLLDFLDAPHNSPGWPAIPIRPVPGKLDQRKREDKFTEVEKEEKQVPLEGPKLQSQYRTSTSG